MKLDITKRGNSVNDFESSLLQYVIGQEEAVRDITLAYQHVCAGIQHTDRPRLSALFSGPSGVGKTRLVEAVARALYGSPKHMIKIDCAEYQHNHEIAKLIGSPPGYLGHRETTAILDRDNVMSKPIILLDEIEKANDTLWTLFLGILDKGSISLGNGQIVDMTGCMIFMTSNLGSREMNRTAIGFTAGSNRSISAKAIREKFSPEFINRLDVMRTFNRLTPEHEEQILSLEIDAVCGRLYAFDYRLEVRPEVRQELLIMSNGARDIRRSVERMIVSPIACLIESGQLNRFDTIVVQDDFEFHKKITKSAAAAVVQTISVSRPTCMSCLGVGGQEVLNKRGVYVYSECVDCKGSGCTPTLEA